MKGCKFSRSTHTANTFCVPYLFWHGTSILNAISKSQWHLNRWQAFGSGTVTTCLNFEQSVVVWIWTPDLPHARPTICQLQLIVLYSKRQLKLVINMKQSALPWQKWMHIDLTHTLLGLVTLQTGISAVGIARNDIFDNRWQTYYE